MNVYKSLFMLLILALCSACGNFEEPESPAKEFKMLVMVNQMVGEEETSRAYSSMTPDRENSIQTLSVFQFDMEGKLRTLENINNKRYLFKKFTNLGDPNGIPMVTESIMPELKHLQSGERMHTCLIANIDSTLLINTLFPRGMDDPVTWTEFQEVKFELPFATQADIELDPTLEIGHLNCTYMFGYYDGDVPPEGFTVGLGRILSRLKITCNVDGVTNDMKFYAAIYNLETHAYFSVSKDSPHHHYFDTAPQLLDKSRFDLTSGKGVLQFYCAPHVGERITAESTTCLYLWCVKGDYVPTMDESDLRRAARIPLGADPLNDKFELARNTFYSFNVNLKFTE